MDAIVTKDLTKVYRDVTAVDRLELTVRTGELFALLGVNGAGKSTAIRMLTGLTRPTRGDALLEGHSVLREKAAVKAIVGLSPQDTAVAPNLTAEENLFLLAGLHGLSRGEREERVEELTRRFGLAPVLHRKAGKLSGGWQRRLSIALALVGSPRILFLDEPTLGLDVLARQELWDVIRSLKGRVTTVLTTHHMEEAEQLSDRVGILASGRLLHVGSPEELCALAGAQRFEDAFVRLVKGGGSL